MGERTDLMSRVDLSRVFLNVGLNSFGGWSTLALLLEKELVDKRKVLTEKDIKGAVAYAQILPGATQVAIVSHVGHKLRGTQGATIATIVYLFPAITLMVLFSALYFRYIHGSNIASHLGGLYAALGGIILANGYRIGKRSARRHYLWLLVIFAFVAKLWIGVNAVIILLTYGILGLVVFWIQNRKSETSR